MFQCLHCHNSSKNPERVPDLLGYQSLIIDDSIQYDGDGCIGYDRRFRLNAAANSTKSWASLDTTLWNLAFTGYAKVSRCKHCFCLTHTSSECEWAPEATDTVTPPHQPSTYFSAMPAKQYRRICRKWNNTPGRCPVPGCTYKHICLNCAYDSTINNKSHKAIQCPKKKHSRAGDSTHIPSDNPSKLLPCLAIIVDRDGSKGWQKDRLIV